MRIRSSRRFVAGVAALVLACATPMALPGAFVPVASAQASASSQIIADDQLAANGINPSITIHKRSGIPNGVANDGKQKDTSTGFENNPPLEGVTFKVQKINGLDIHRNSSWELVNHNKGNTDIATWTKPGGGSAEGLSLAVGTEETTGSAGEASFSNLELGFYIVTETAVPAGSGYVKGKPFLVSLPMSDPDAGSAASASAPYGWNYNVHLYPKNNKFATLKATTQEDLTATGVNYYRVYSDIPVATSGQETDFDLIFSDLLDERFGSGNINYAAFFDPAQPNISQPLGEPLHDELNDSFVRTDETVSVGGVNRVHVYAKLKDNKRQWLADIKKAHPTIQIVHLVQAHYNPDVVRAKGGEITNRAYVWAGLPSQGNAPTPTQPVTTVDSNDPGWTNEVKTYLGSVKVKKVAADGNDAPLAGAEFKVAACTSSEPVVTVGDQNGKPGQYNAQSPADANYVRFSGDGDPNNPASYIATTNSAGEVLIQGLHVSDFNLNMDVTNAVNPKDNRFGIKGTGDHAFGFCLFETKAPAGYEKLPEPIFFQLSRASYDTPLELTIKEPSTNAGFDLPLTGGRGIILFAVLGGGLLLMAAFLARRNKKNAE